MTTATKFLAQERHFRMVWRHFVEEKKPFGVTAHRDNPDRLACCYFDFQTGARCAVGICVDEVTARRLASQPGWQNRIGLLMHLLPAELQELGQTFWTELQNCHDCAVLGPCPSLDTFTEAQKRDELERNLRDMARRWGFKL